MATSHALLQNEHERLKEVHPIPRTRTHDRSEDVVSYETRDRDSKIQKSLKEFADANPCCIREYPVVKCACRSGERESLTARLMFKNRNLQTETINKDSMRRIANMRLGSENIFTRAVNEKLYDRLRNSGAYLLIEGETGTCKTLYAQYCYNYELAVNGGYPHGLVWTNEWEFFARAMAFDETTWSSYYHDLTSARLLVLDNWFCHPVLTADSETTKLSIASSRYAMLTNWIYQESKNIKRTIIITTRMPENRRFGNASWSDMERRVFELFITLKSADRELPRIADPVAMISIDELFERALESL